MVIFKILEFFESLPYIDSTLNTFIIKVDNMDLHLVMERYTQLKQIWNDNKVDGNEYSVDLPVVF